MQSASSTANGAGQKVRSLKPLAVCEPSPEGVDDELVTERHLSNEPPSHDKRPTTLWRHLLGRCARSCWPELLPTLAQLLDPAAVYFLEVVQPTDRTVRDVLFPPHTSRAPGKAFETQLKALVRWRHCSTQDDRQLGTPTCQGAPQDPPDTKVKLHHHQFQSNRAVVPLSKDFVHERRLRLLYIYICIYINIYI